VNAAADKNAAERVDLSMSRIRASLEIKNGFPSPTDKNASRP